ncbi:hypothetical protein NDU88_000241 [Pleurodeles waltl]|uniref:Uncharacterized protein n=1 Tax=Pleurodeles waltl TaxID=8319 RepID=A0AAV7VWT9_PLEWA|nr:hypothetical protein NDU88_000241 [Pleurodeles waltl]
MSPPDYIYLRSKVPKLRPIDSTRIPSAVKSRKCDAFRDIYTNVKECTSLDTRYHGGGLMELQRALLPACARLGTSVPLERFHYFLNTRHNLVLARWLQTAPSENRRRLLSLSRPYAPLHAHRLFLLLLHPLPSLESAGGRAGTPH